MDSLAKHVLRRGLEHGHDTLKHANDVDPLRLVLIVGFGALSVLAMGIICYTYSEVIATLAMIESPSATLYVPVPSEDAPDSTLKDAAKIDEKADPELAMVQEKMITSSLCRSYQHLISVGGRAGRFRGISMAIVTHLMTLGLAKAFACFLPRSFFSLSVSIVLSQVVLANFYLGWNHIAISRPSAKYWYQRIPTVSVWKKVALPTLILAIAEEVSTLLPVYLSQVWGLDTMTAESFLKDMRVCKVLIVGLIGIAATFLVAIPARVTLTRVQASLLPADQETIVPVDRTFGGKVVPEAVGGSGMVGLLDAWKTFDFASRIRLIKLYAKIIVLQIVVALALVVVGGSIILLTSKAPKSTTGPN